MGNERGQAVVLCCIGDGEGQAGEDLCDGFGDREFRDGDRLWLRGEFPCHGEGHCDRSVAKFGMEGESVGQVGVVVSVGDVKVVEGHVE